jgi:FAD binding domain/Berberine and berberine like
MKGARVDTRYDRREILRRAAQGAVGLGATGVLWPLAPAGAAADPRLAALARRLDGDLVPRGGKGYAQARLGWNPRFDDTRPLAVAYAETIADVRRVIGWASDHDVRLATRSGGHSFAGYSTTPGIVLDLSRLTNVHVNADGTAAVAAGAKLGSVYARLWSRGRAVPFGTCEAVGVSGLTLGGGHGYSSRALGLACDNVTRIEVVTADGKPRVCDAQREPELFWALRGAGAGNFGVVTKLVYRTHPVDFVTTVNLRWPWANTRQVVKDWQAFAPTAADSLSSTLSFASPPPAGGTPSVAVNGQVFGTRDEALALLAPLTDAVRPTRVAAVHRPFISAVTYFAADNPARRSFAAKSNYGLAPLPAAAIDVIIAAFESAARDPRLGAVGSLLFAHGGAINRAVGGPTAYVHRSALFSIRYSAFWSTTAPADVAEAHLGWVRNTHAAMQPFVHGAVTNYADPELEAWGSEYYGSHLGRLVAVKRHYDPDNLFRFPQSIPTRLPAR